MDFTLRRIVTGNHIYVSFDVGASWSLSMQETLQLLADATASHIGDKHATLWVRELRGAEQSPHLTLGVQPCSTAQEYHDGMTNIRVLSRGLRALADFLDAFEDGLPDQEDEPAPPESND